jgi:hypothetical protein
VLAEVAFLGHQLVRNLNPVYSLDKWKALDAVDQVLGGLIAKNGIDGSYMAVNRLDMRPKLGDDFL